MKVLETYTTDDMTKIHIALEHDNFFVFLQDATNAVFTSISLSSCQNYILNTWRVH